MVTIACGSCGHTDDYMFFTRTPVYGDLPKDIFQCPKCRTAILRKHGAPVVYDSGFVAPGKIELVNIEARF